MTSKMRGKNPRFLEHFSATKEHWELSFRILMAALGLHLRRDSHLHWSLLWHSYSTKIYGKSEKLRFFVHFPAIFQAIELKFLTNMDTHMRYWSAKNRPIWLSMAMNMPLTAPIWERGTGTWSCPIEISQNSVFIGFTVIQLRRVQIRPPWSPTDFP